MYVVETIGRRPRVTEQAAITIQKTENRTVLKTDNRNRLKSRPNTNMYISGIDFMVSSHNHFAIIHLHFIHVIYCCLRVYE